MKRVLAVLVLSGIFSCENVAAQESSPTPEAPALDAPATETQATPAADASAPDAALPEAVESANPSVSADPEARESDAATVQKDIPLPEAVVRQAPEVETPDAVQAPPKAVASPAPRAVSSRPAQRKRQADQPAAATPPPVQADTFEIDSSEPDVANPNDIAERNAPPSTGTIGQPPPGYAGGQVATGGQVGLLGNRSVFDTPVSMKSYTATGIQNRQATSVTQVLDTDPSVVSLGRNSPFEYFNIRGFLSRQPYDSRYDGLNLPHLQASVPELYERIEVIKGPSALLYPQLGGIAGTINYVPKLASDEGIAQLTTSISSDTQVRGHLDVGRRYGLQGEWGVRANIVGNTGDTYRQHGESDLAAGSLALDYRGDRFRFALHGDVADSKLNDMQGFGADFTGIGTVPVPDPKKVGSFSNGQAYDALSSRGYATAEIDFSDALTAFAKFGASQTDSKFDAISYCSFDRTGRCLLAPYRYDEYRSYVAGELGLRAQLDTGFIRHRMTVSGSASEERMRDAGDGYQLFDEVDTNFFDPQSPLVRTPIYTATDYSERTKIKTFAVVDTLSVLNDAVQVTIGARRQSVESSGMFDGDRDPSYDESELTPMYGIVVKPGFGLSLYASYIEALEVGGSADSSAANFPTTLPPAVSEQKEIGAKWDFGSFAMTLAYFDITRPNDFVDSNNIFGRNGEQRNRGVEVEVFGEPIRGVRLMGGVTFLDAEIVASEGGALDGKRPTSAPEFVAKFGAEWDVPMVKGLTLTGLILHTDEQFANADNSAILADWTRFDVGARYQLTDSIVVRGLVENVGNERYWESSQDGFFLSIGAPRTYSLSTTVNF